MALILKREEELIASNNSIEEIREIIGADSLTFLSEDGLVDAIGRPYEGKYGGLCMACFNGEYPTEIYDYEQELLESMNKTKKASTSFD